MTSALSIEILFSDPLRMSEKSLGLPMRSVLSWNGGCHRKDLKESMIQKQNIIIAEQLLDFTSKSWVFIRKGGEKQDHHKP